MTGPRIKLKLGKQETSFGKGIIPLIVPGVWPYIFCSNTYYYIFLTFTYFDEFAQEITQMNFHSIIYIILSTSYYLYQIAWKFFTFCYFIFNQSLNWLKAVERMLKKCSFTEAWSRDENNSHWRARIFLLVPRRAFTDIPWEKNNNFWPFH